MKDFPNRHKTAASATDPADADVSVTTQKNNERTQMTNMQMRIANSCDTKTPTTQTHGQLDTNRSDHPYGLEQHIASVIRLDK